MISIALFNDRPNTIIFNGGGDDDDDDDDDNNQCYSKLSKF